MDETEVKTVKKVKKAPEPNQISIERKGRMVTVTVKPEPCDRRLECYIPNKGWEFMYDVVFEGAKFTIDTRKKRATEVRLVRIIQTKKL